MSNWRGLPYYLRAVAFWLGGVISKLDPDAVEKCLLFILAVARVIVKATPTPADDAVITVVGPAIEHVAELIGDLDDD